MPLFSESARSKRASTEQNTCHIMAVADYTFFTGPGGGFPHRTANYIVSICTVCVLACLYVYQFPTLYANRLVLVQVESGLSDNPVVK